MKKIKLLVYALIMCMSFVSVAEAKGRSGSFKSGFASQKRSAPKPAPTYAAPVAPAADQTKKTAFGSFGAASPKTQANATAPESQMSKDLSDKAAQTNALKTADARKTNDAPAASESGWFRSGDENASAQKPQSANYGQATNNNASNNTNANTNRQTFERRNGGQQTSGRSNGLMYGLLGFMVGNSLAHHASAAPVQQQNNDWQNDNSNGNATNSLNADGSVMQQAQEVPAEETELLFMKLLRVVLWGIVIGGVIWVVRKVLNFRQRKFNRSTNYSLGS